jgi:choline dehydrogenase-like flavoprotein
VPAFAVSDLPYLQMLSPAEQRAAIALAEAIIPGSPNIRAADERAVAYVVRVAHDMAPPLVAAVGKLVRLLDLAATAQTGHSFANLSRDAQDRLLQRWYLDPVMRNPMHAVSFGLKFMHFDAARGYVNPRSLDVVKTLEQPAYLQQIIRGDDYPEEEVECEAVVVGTGAGGAVVGKELADRGLAVVFVEEGEHYRRDAMTGSGVDAHYKFYRGAFVVGQSMFPVFMGRMVGGSTAINTGSCFRTPDFVLDEWCDTLHTDTFSPENMRAHFERVERTLPVEAPARKHVGPIADVIERGCARFGWKNGPIMRNAVGCEGDGFCDFGCPTDARRSTNLSYVPPALKKGAICLTGLRCDEIHIENGRAVGIVGVTKNGKRIRVRARAVVLAMGAIPTPQFLLERGLCNSSGQVGRNLSIHPSVAFSALMDEEINGRRHIPQGWHISEFVKEGILISAAQTDENFSGILFSYNGRPLMNVLEKLDRIVSFGVIVRDRKRQGRVARSVYDHAVIRYTFTPEDVELAHRGMVNAGEMCLAAGAKALYPTMMSVPPIETPADWERFKRMKPSANQSMFVSYHPLGTCQIGSDPKTSVVGLDHETHDVKSLYIVDGSTVPGPPGVNPQITIMSLATRASAYIADALGARAPMPTADISPQLDAVSTG